MIDSDDNFSFIFKPVVISRGRKFKGKAYYLGQDSERAVAWGVTVRSTKLWDPANKCYVYANPDFCDDDTNIQDDQIKTDRLEYINKTINDTIEWCKTKVSDEAEASRFARSCLIKHHPEMMTWIDDRLPDIRDVVAAVDRTLQWAMTLKSRPMHIYGRFCPGGKKYSNSKIKDIAIRYLCRKGYDKLEGFNEAWDLYLNIYGLK